MSKEQTDRTDAVARALYFDFCDCFGWPNGRPTWDEMLSIPSEAPMVAQYRSHAEAAIRVLSVIPPEAQAVAWRGDHAVDTDEAERRFTSIERVAQIWRDQGLTVTPLYAASPSPAGGVQAVTMDAAEMQILDRLKRDNTHDGVRSVIESDFEPWFSLSERGLIAMEQHARGIIPHITRLGVRALTAALSSQAQTTGGVE